MTSLLCISTQYWVIQKLSIESDLIEPVYPRCDARPVRVPSQGIAPEPTHRINKSTRSYTQVDSSRGESRGSTRADSGLGARTSRLALRQKPRQHKSRLRSGRKDRYCMGRVILGGRASIAGAGLPPHALTTNRGFSTQLPEP